MLIYLMYVHTYYTHIQAHFRKEEIYNDGPRVYIRMDDDGYRGNYSKHSS